MTLALACLCAWLLGGIPFGLLLVRALKGVDLRRIGSGNIGATNASRAFGSRAQLPMFALIYVLDFAKGFVPAAWFAAAFGVEPSQAADALLGAAAVAGHCFSPFLGLRGGKGVATTTGVFAAIEPFALGIAIATFFVALVLSKHRVFVGSLALGVALAVAVILRDPGSAFGERLPATVLSVAIAAFLFWTHRSNLARLRAERIGGST